MLLSNPAITSPSAPAPTADAEGDVISKQQPAFTSDLLTPEALWAMGRIGSATLSPTSSHQAAYAVTYYNVQQNKSRTVIYGLDLSKSQSTLLTSGSESQRAPRFMPDGAHIAYLSSQSGSSQLWLMNTDGTEKRQISHTSSEVSDYLFSPDGKKVILIMEVPTTSSIAAPEADLPLATGMVINDLMYKHWDTYTKTIPHPFVASFDGESVATPIDLLAGEPYECPMLPFGGIEQLAWSPDSKTIAYTCRKKTGKAYAISTDSDIYLYDIASGTTRDLCKPLHYRPYACEKQGTSDGDTIVEPARSLQNQYPNLQDDDVQAGYDVNPVFSPCGRYLAWSSRERDGYESDRARLCVLDLQTGTKSYVTEAFDSDVNEFVWAADSRSLYFTGVWHAKTQVYQVTLKGKVSQLTDDVADYALVELTSDGKALLVKRHSISQADELYLLNLEAKKGKHDVTQLTTENQYFYDHLTFGKVEERWIPTSDGKKELCWIIYPPHFDPSKQYPALLYCQGGPQSPVSQFWSYRWNFQIMAANGYIIVAPNRRGLPGFGSAWNEAISGDYPGQCMRDYLSAIDCIAREPYVDASRLGCVGASFGGYSVYWLAGHHDKRFKAFIAHDGIFNTTQQYMETEELWFANWDMGSAPWLRDAQDHEQDIFRQSPHLFVDRWDTPILCIHGQRDFRIEYTQAESAFTAARMRGLDAQLLLFPDENHWVLRPQNGILWQRTFFRWLDKYLK